MIILTHLRIKVLGLLKDEKIYKLVEDKLLVTKTFLQLEQIVFFNNKIKINHITIYKIKSKKPLFHKFLMNKMIQMNFLIRT